MSICRDNTQPVDLSFSVFSAIAVIIELVLGVFKKVSKVVCVSFELSEGFLCWLITTRSYSPSISGFGVSWDPLVSTVGRAERSHSRPFLEGRKLLSGTGRERM